MKNRKPWPTDKAPIRVNVKCPICGSALFVDAGEDLELDDNGQWIASSLQIHCESEPNIHSNEWDEWFNWHYSQPYTDWLPLEMSILKAVRRKYYFEYEGK